MPQQSTPAVPAQLTIRPYQASDRTVIRRICADTGFLGRPIDPIFEDRQLFADYLTSYYLSIEPDATLVCEVAGEVRGYLMGCCRPLMHQAYQSLANTWLGARAVYRCCTRPYGTASRDFLRWIALNAWREVPAAPRSLPHFHINLLPEARSVKYTRLLIQSFLELLRARGHRRFYGQMVTYDDRRNEELFARYGFRVAARSEVTKFRGSFPGRVFLSTVIGELGSGPLLSSARRLERAARDESQ